MMTVIDALNTLMQNEAEIVTSEINYNSESHTNNEESKFVIDDTVSKIHSVVYNDNRANVSILFKIKGHVDIGQNGFNLPESFPTHVWKNYTVIRDGALNIESLPVKVDEIAFNSLKEQGIFAGEFTGDVMNLDLRNFELYEDCPAEEKIEKFLLNNVEYNFAKGAKKVYAAFYEEFKNEKSELTANYGAEGSAFLAGFGISDNGYFNKNQTKEKVEGTFPVIKVKMKGISTVPSVNALRDKINASKKLNVIENYMKNCYQECEEKKNMTNFSEYLTEKMKGLDKNMKRLATEMGKDKINFVLNRFPKTMTTIDVAEIGNITCEISKE